MEALFASFLLLTSILLSVQLFDSSLQAEANNEQRTIAALVAESALDEIRASTNQDFTSLRGAYNGRTWNLPDYPHFQIKASVDTIALATPCSELESQYANPAAPFPQPRPRLLEGSVWEVQLEITWPRGGSEGVTVVEYFSSLQRAGNFEVEISPPGGTPINDLTNGTFAVARDRTKDFTASARADGRPLKDVQFSWYVEPLDGFGSINRVSRDGTECRYKNAYRNSNNAILYSPGKCDLVVRAVYQGIESVRKVRIENGG
jgi:hypothetical protein